MAKRKRKLKPIWKFIFIVLIIIFAGYTGIKYFIKDDIVTNTTTNIKDNIIKTEEKKKSVNITAFGDLMFEQPYLNALNNGESTDTYLNLINEKYFTKDDISVGNLEIPITDGTLEVSGANYSFCAPQSVGYMLGKQSIEVLSTTNNHSADRGIAGINSTLDFLRNNTTIKTIGSFKTKEERGQKVIIEKNGIKVGFIAYAMGTNKYVAPEERWRLGLFRDMSLSPFQITDEYRNIIRTEVRELKQECDVIIAVMHWGQEYQYNERDDQRELATLLNEEGVNVIIGGHSHCLQPMKWVERSDGFKTLVFYSLGNTTSADPALNKSQEFDNAYQVGLIANFDIEEIDGNYEITNIKTEPIINYYDTNQRNYLVVPYSSYSKYETSHYRYQQGLTNEFILNSYNKVIDEEFRTQ